MIKSRFYPAAAVETHTTQMFSHLTEKLTRTLKNIRGAGRLSEENISATLREVRMTLLEADVALPVAKQFIQQVKERALGREIQSSLSPGQALIKIVHEELIALMGGGHQGLHIDVPPPAVILTVGLQGAGKTTTVARLGYWIKRNLKKTVMVASCDVYRPAAIEQLRILASDNDLLWRQENRSGEPAAIAEEAVTFARRQSADVLIIDTAGRLHIDERMMREIQELQQQLAPVETLFIMDSMMGQDAVNAAGAFGAAVALSGIILTKTDSDARGGAALTARHSTGCPIKFLGTGEKIDELIPFHPERIASRILGMGDTLSLIEELQQKTDHAKTEKWAGKIKKGRGFNLVDFREQLDQIITMGGLGSVLDKLPGMAQLPVSSEDTATGQFIRWAAIIDSMTPDERRRPAVLNGSRKRRIAQGSGGRIQDVNRLLKQFTQMQKMMKRFAKKGGTMEMLRNFSGHLPPGMKF